MTTPVPSESELGLEIPPMMPARDDAVIEQGVLFAAIAHRRSWPTPANPAS
jgi:hypothetical protein